MHISSEAIVLRRTEYGEADRIVNFLTPDLGRIGAVAKSVRKPSSKLAGGIEPFSIVNISVRRGRGDLYTLTSAQMQNNFSNITKDYGRLQLGYMMMGKINRAAETLHEVEIYDILKTSLASLDNISIDERLSETWFHLQHLHLLGHSLNLSRDVGGKRLLVDARYNFSVPDMAFTSHENGDFSADHLKVFKILQLKTPALVASIRGVEQVIDECLRLVRILDE